MDAKIDGQQAALRYKANPTDENMALVVEGFSKMVHRIAHAMLTKARGGGSHTKLDLEDLRQMGFMGLIDAINRWDPEHKEATKFSTYAQYYIFGYITRLLRGNMLGGSLIRYPEAVSAGILKARNAFTKLEQRLFRFPTVEELMQESKQSEKICLLAIQRCGGHTNYRSGSSDPIGIAKLCGDQVENEHDSKAELMDLGCNIELLRKQGLTEIEIQRSLGIVSKTQYKKLLDYLSTV